jgi:hypothetical protein
VAQITWIQRFCALNCVIQKRVSVTTQLLLSSTVRDTGTGTDPRRWRKKAKLVATVGYSTAIAHDRCGANRRAAPTV